MGEETVPAPPPPGPGMFGGPAAPTPSAEDSTESTNAVEETSNADGDTSDASAANEDAPNANVAATATAAEVIPEAPVIPQVTVNG